MATFIIQGEVHLTAQKYCTDKYRKAGFKVQVFDEDEVLGEGLISFNETDENTGRDIYEITRPIYIDIDSPEPKFRFRIVHEQDEVNLQTTMAIPGPAYRKSETIYSGTIDVGYIIVTIEVPQAASMGGSEKPHGSVDDGSTSMKTHETIGGIVHGDGELAQQIKMDPGIAQNLRSPRVSLRRPEVQPSEDQPFWVAIRDRANAIGFNNYKTFVDDVLCNRDSHGFEESLEAAPNSLRTHMGSVDAYKLLEVATEAFLLMHCGVKIEEDGYKATEEARRLEDTVEHSDIKKNLEAYLGNDGARLPYLRQIISNLSLSANDSDLCGSGFMKGRVDSPCLMELIWSYWHEEGMLVQTMNAVSMRFQNRRISDRDPLANLEIDPLRPLNNLLWGFIQDELHRLSLPRRAYEYDHHYGFRLTGKAVPTIKPADSRSKFIEAFHNLLHQAHLFYQEDADLNVISDGFQLLNALREVHLILAYGAHNQFGDLPWTARKEMLIMQWLLARPEMRGFLGGRAMVPYAEGWMAQVDSMKQLQRWTDTSITHFRDLAVYGEQLLLSIRYANWHDVNNPHQAKNWARYWRPEVQRYIYAYKAVTGVDLSTDVVSTERAKARYLQPSVHLQRQLNKQTNQQQKAETQSRRQGKPAAATAKTNGRG